MESVLGFLKGLDVMQVLAIAAGVFLLWPQKRESQSHEKTVRTDKEGSLTDIVAKWESLYDACDSKGLDEACKGLEKIFPSLIPKRVEESTSG